MRGIILGICIAIAAPAIAAPHVTIADARKIALARVPGTIVHEKLKHAKKKKKTHEAHDHYNIKVKPRDNPKSGMVKKVEIDAETGAILEIKDVKAKAYDD
jgi:uncharacterized membrane protein YkoI